MGTRNRKPQTTIQTLKVLSVILSSSEELAGVEISNATKLASGTLYPILLRLEEAGWLTSRWEVDQPQALGRPRRRLYKVTKLGAKEAKAALNEMRSAFNEVVWA